jgi:tetratricopeptide (TPR) repeat protein
MNSTSIAFASTEALSSEHLIKARQLAERGKRREALVQFMVALEVAERPAPDLYMEVAKAHADLGKDIPKALSVLDAGLARLGNVTSLQDMAVAFELNRRHFTLALKRQQLLLDSAKHKETRLFQRGKILAQAGRRREARTFYREALAVLDSQPDEQRQTVAALALKKSVKEQLRLIDKPKKNKVTAKSTLQPGK